MRFPWSKSPTVTFRRSPTVWNREDDRVEVSHDGDEHLLICFVGTGGYNQVVPAKAWTVLPGFLKWSDDETWRTG